MAFQFSDAYVHGALDGGEAAIGTSPTLQIRTGAPPANCAAADTGTLLASMALPSDWQNAASSRQKTKSGTWEDLSADAAGIAGHFRIKQGATCHIQGPVVEGTSAADGEMALVNTDITATQPVTISAFTLTGPAA